MTKIMLCTIVLFGMCMPTLTMADAFEYHGIKSGMSKSELIEYLKLKEIARNKQRELGYFAKKSMDDVLNFIFSIGVHQRDLEEVNHPKLSNKKFTVIFPIFTDDDILYCIHIRYAIPTDPLEVTALKKALDESFPEISIEKKLDEAFGRSYYSVLMIDEKIATESIKQKTITPASEYMTIMRPLHR